MHEGRKLLVNLQIKAFTNWKNQKGSGNCEIPIMLKPPSGNLFSRIPAKRGSCQGTGRGGAWRGPGLGCPAPAPLLPVLVAATLPGEATDADPVLQSCSVLAEGTRCSKWQYTRAQFTSPLEPKPLRWFQWMLAEAWDENSRWKLWGSYLRIRSCFDIKKIGWFIRSTHREQFLPTNIIITWNSDLQEQAL